MPEETRSYCASRKGDLTPGWRIFDLGHSHTVLTLAITWRGRFLVISAYGAEEEIEPPVGDDRR